MQIEQLKELLNSMTLREKLGQMTQFPVNYYLDEDNLTGPLEEANISESDLWLAGSTLSFSNAKSAIEVQKKFLSKSRLGIPAFFGGDVIHGFRTMFPIPLAMGASWNPDLIKLSAEISAKEAAVSGIHVNYSPMVDLVRDPRWGRVMESTGEDPYLNEVLAKAFVEGYQGADFDSTKYNMAACVKHFAAYGAPDGGRDYNIVDMSELKLRQSYLSAYKAALDANAKMVMTSFNTVFGVPATGNKWLMRNVLRDEWNFDGVVISDWGAVTELINHGLAENKKDAAKLAIEAGTDIEMATTAYLNAAEQLVEEGKLDEELINQSTWNILKLKNDLGLFENPFRFADVDLEKEFHLAEEHLNASLEVAKRSIVLLKNEDKTLPLGKAEKVALLGPGAKINDLIGSWPGFGRREEAEPLESVLAKNIDNLNTLDLDCDHENISAEYINAAVDLAKKVDKVILALGEPSAWSGEARSLSNIALNTKQIDLFDAVRAVNENVIVLINNGRPLDLSGIDGAKAIVLTWFLGNKASEATKAVLLGEYNPSGRLTMSFPQNVGQVPIHYNNFNTGRPLQANSDDEYVSKYLDIPNEAKYVFGYGLSYSDVEYSNLTLDKDDISSSEKLIVTVEVENKSDIEVIETVQLYIRDLKAEVIRPVKELKDFQQVTLQAHEKQKLTFELGEDKLRYYHLDMSYKSDKGRFEVMVGPNSQDLLKSEFELI